MTFDYLASMAGRLGRLRLAGVLLAAFATAPCLALPLGAQGSSTTRASVDRRFAAAPDASIRLFGAFSSLRVIGWDRDSVEITGSVPKGWRFDGGVASSPGSLPRSAKFFVDAPSDIYPTGAALEIRVPARARVWAKSGSADITVSGVTGGLDLNIVGGSVTVSDAPRELNIESMDGNVKVLNGAAWLRVKTASGEIDVRGGSEDAGLSTVSGTVRVADGRYERGKLETVTGDIIYVGDVGQRASVDLTTHSGRIELRLLPKPNVELDAMTVTGAIENAVTSNRPVPGREGRGMELGFSSGGGSTRIVARSFKGNIVVRQR